MKKPLLLIESSAIEDPRLTGVGYFSQSIAQGIDKIAKKNNTIVGYFWLNFLGRKAPISSVIKQASLDKRLFQIHWIPQRVYAKLVAYRIAPPLKVPSSDWVLFPNFYTWPVISSAKRAVIIHDICHKVYPQYVEDKNRQFLDRVIKKSIQSADLIISNSKFTSDEIQKNYNVPNDKLLTIDIPIDTSQFIKSQAKTKKYLQKRYQITKPYILTFGTIEPRKNIDMMVDAYCALPDDIRDKYSLVIAGKWGWKIDDLRTKIERLQTEGYDIITPGYIEHDDRSTFYYNASYYIITTHYEGFGMPLLEAMYCGLPTVAVDIPVLREVGADGCSWAKKEVGDIADKLTRLIEDSDYAEKLSRKATAQANSFSWTKTSQKVYDYLIANK